LESWEHRWWEKSWRESVEEQREAKHDFLRNADSHVPYAHARCAANDHSGWPVDLGFAAPDAVLAFQRRPAVLAVETSAESFSACVSWHY
jgi:hypothetical protein